MLTPNLNVVVQILKEHGIALPSGTARITSFGDSAKLSENLLSLIKSGKKCAGSALLWALEFDDEPIAREKDTEIVLDSQGMPAVVTSITEVVIVPFREVTAEFAAREGEGNCSLIYWQKEHWRFFTKECQRISRSPTEDMEIVCLSFEVLHIVPTPASQTI